MALAGRSCRTRNERETIAFGEPMARVEVELDDAGETSTFLWSLARGGDRRHLRRRGPDGPGARATAARRSPCSSPTASAWSRGRPADRRAHLDGLLAALWPARAEARRALWPGARPAKRAARPHPRRRIATEDSLEAWDLELAAAGHRAHGGAAATPSNCWLPSSRARPRSSGLPGEGSLRYRPRSDASDPRRAGRPSSPSGGSADVARGYYAARPPPGRARDRRSTGDRSRRYGSQGEQRAALLSLLFAERRALLEARRNAAADPARRRDERARSGSQGAAVGRGSPRAAGQALITATEAAHLPATAERTEIAMRSGAARARASVGAGRGGPGAFAA